MLGEIGRINDVVFIETTQIASPTGYGGTGAIGAPPGDHQRRRPLGGHGLLASRTFTHARPGRWTARYQDTGPGVVATPGWGDTWPYPLPKIYDGLMIGDNAFGHAISLPVELRDGGVLDFGREHALAWYGIWGFGVITDSAVVRLVTN